MLGRCRTKFAGRAPLGRGSYRFRTRASMIPITKNERISHPPNITGNTALSLASANSHGQNPRPRASLHRDCGQRTGANGCGQRNVCTRLQRRCKSRLIRANDARRRYFMRALSHDFQHSGKHRRAHAGSREAGGRGLDFRTRLSGPAGKNCVADQARIRPRTIDLCQLQDHPEIFGGFEIV